MRVEVNGSRVGIRPIAAAARSGTGRDSGENERRQGKNTFDRVTGNQGEPPSESKKQSDRIELTLSIKGSHLFFQHIAKQAAVSAHGDWEMTFSGHASRTQEQDLEAARRRLNRFLKADGKAGSPPTAYTKKPNALEVAKHYRAIQPFSSNRMDVYCSSTTEAKPGDHGRGTYLHRTIDDQPEAQQTAWLIQRTVEKNGRIELPAHGQSMYPFIRKDDLCTFAACPASSLKQGDIALYIAKNGRLIAHRFIRPIFRVHQTLFVFKGDTNLLPDAPVSAEQIIGKLVAIRKTRVKFRLSHLLGQRWSRLVVTCPIVSRYLKKYLNLKNRLPR